MTPTPSLAERASVTAVELVKGAPPLIEREDVGAVASVPEMLTVTLTALDTALLLES